MERVILVGVGVVCCQAMDGSGVWRVRMLSAIRTHAAGVRIMCRVGLYLAEGVVRCTCAIGLHVFCTHYVAVEGCEVNKSRLVADISHKKCLYSGSGGGGGELGLETRTGNR